MSSSEARSEASSSSIQPRSTARRKTAARGSAPGGALEREAPGPLAGVGAARTPRTPVDLRQRLGHAVGRGLELDRHRDLPLQALAQLVGAAFGDDPAAIDDQHPAAEQLDLGQDVGREQQGVLASELADQLADGDDLLRVEPDGRLVEDQDLRVVEDRRRRARPAGGSPSRGCR